MEPYIELCFQNVQEQTDVLIALLSELGFEGFEERDGELKAYIAEKQFDEAALKDMLSSLPGKAPSYTISTIQPQNWNQIWEQSFEPIVVSGRVTVRAPFHPKPSTEYDIVIEPKMAFGTGHHESTHMCIEHMLTENLKGKTVIDFGCGTGILAILAAKMGADEIAAVDNDPLAVESTNENATQNGISNIIANLGAHEAITGTVDLILANINRNVILSTLATLTEHLKPQGILIVAGILADDKAVVQNKARDNQLLLVGAIEKNNWIGLKFQKK